MIMGDMQEVYPLARDEAESIRLNAQHNMLVDIVGGPIDKSIPLENISSVADVATGTGIWLLDAQAQLNAHTPSPTAIGTRTYHGFDISAAQFPPSSEKQGISLSVHDILHPFPTEHHNRYDLVHVRMLVAALKAEEYEVAVRNLVPILKPGGYLQWTDLDSSSLPSSPSFTDPRTRPIITSWFKFFELNNLSTCPTTTLRSAYESSKLVDISSTTYLVRGRDELKERAQVWEIQGFSAFMAPVLMATGEVGSQKEAEKRAKEVIGGLQEYFYDDEVLDLRMGVIVGRKAV
ncbi:hypothetical protein BJX63DRAFT_328958 [Aspergillus granulosus]|uniref:Methyltransferase domain-containing protein n=1 Tax=Aspergillus granulosus TaxID=176169 RepID=A0ABR4H3Z5_9EURO